MAVSYLFAGQPEQTTKFMDMAIRSSPNDPLMWSFLGNKGIAHGILREFESGIACLEEACRFPAAAFIPFTMLAALYALADRISEDEKSLDQARRLEPGLSPNHMREYYGTADRQSFEIYFEGFDKAGLTG